MKYVLYDLDTGAVSVFCSDETLQAFLTNVRKNLSSDETYEENIDYQLYGVDAVDPLE